MRRRILSGREMGFAIVAGAVAALGCYLMPGLSSLVAQVEYRTVDWRFHIRGVRRPGSDIVIVGIDEDSLAEIGRWPWPRSKVAALLEAIEAARPKLVAFDVLFGEPSPPAEDSALEKTLKRYDNVLLPVFVSTSSPPEWFFGLPQVRKWQRIAVAGARQGQGVGIFHVRGLDVPLRRFAVAAADLGAAEIVGSADGIYREVPLLMEYEGHFVPSLPLAIGCATSGTLSSSVEIVPGQAVIFNGRRFYMDPYGLTPIDFAGPSGTFPTVSARAVLALSLIHI